MILAKKIVVMKINVDKIKIIVLWRGKNRKKIRS